MYVAQTHMYVTVAVADIYVAYGDVWATYMPLVCPLYGTCMLRVSRVANILLNAK